MNNERSKAIGLLVVLCLTAAASCGAYLTIWLLRN